MVGQTKLAKVAPYTYTFVTLYDDGFHKPFAMVETRKGLRNARPIITLPLT